MQDENTISNIGNLDCRGTPAGSGGYTTLARTAGKVDLGGLEVLVASIDDLILMKRSSAHPKDLIEVEILSAVRDEIENE